MFTPILPEPAIPPLAAVFVWFSISIWLHDAVCHSTALDCDRTELFATASVSRFCCWLNAPAATLTPMLPLALTAPPTAVFVSEYGVENTPRIVMASLG